jgi:hypothetical protein
MRMEDLHKTSSIRGVFVTEEFLYSNALGSFGGHPTSVLQVIFVNLLLYSCRPLDGLRNSPDSLDKFKDVFVVTADI